MTGRSTSTTTRPRERRRTRFGEAQAGTTDHAAEPHEIEFGETFRKVMEIGREIGFEFPR